MGSRIKISYRIKDLTGKKFVRLKVISFAGIQNRLAMWRCKCECGKERVVRGLSLRTGHTKSCGCFKRKHGLGSTKTYYSWVDMRRRCFNKGHYQYPKYGQVGITVCKRWMKFMNFLEDMGIRPEGKSLDRINGKKGYSKENCHWATPLEQILNRNITRWITFNGQTLCMSHWAKKIGISGWALHWRIDIAGWPLKMALTEPANANLRRHY